MGVIRSSLELSSFIPLLQMRQNRILRGIHDRGQYVACPSGANDEVLLLRQRLLRANHG
jgi:hypothetical protein